MASMKKLITLAAAGVLATTLGCSDALEQFPILPDSIGKYCTVYLRRDAMGMSADLPAPAATQNLNGVDLTVGGLIVETNASWIRLETEPGTVTIPCSVILMVEQPGD